MSKERHQAYQENGPFVHRSSKINARKKSGVTTDSHSEKEGVTTDSHSEKEGVTTDSHSEKEGVTTDSHSEKEGSTCDLPLLLFVIWGFLYIFLSQVQNIPERIMQISTTGLISQDNTHTFNI